jgi:hypothetical protein
MLPPGSSILVLGTGKRLVGVPVDVCELLLEGIANIALLGDLHLSLAAYWESQSDFLPTLMAE